MKALENLDGLYNYGAQQHTGSWGIPFTLDYFEKLSGGADASNLIIDGDKSCPRQSVQVTSWQGMGEIEP